MEENKEPEKKPDIISRLTAKVKSINWRHYFSWRTYVNWFKSVNWRHYFSWHTYVNWFKSVNWKHIFNPHTYIDWFKAQDWRGKWEHFRTAVNSGLSALQDTGRTLIFAVVCAFLLMAVTCLAVFFMVVKGQEKVMVPNVVGRQLTDALLELQVKELYPKIQLRYSNHPDDANMVLEQNPEEGSIVKAGRRITLVVSRGVILDHVENYVGMNIDDLKIKLQTVFAGSSTPLIVLSDPSYKADKAAAGTILAQNPPEGTQITTPVKLELVVSRGPDEEKITVPDLAGKSVNDVLHSMSVTKLVFDFTQHTAAGSEQPGTVTSEQAFTSSAVTAYTHVKVDFAMPLPGSGDTEYGIFTDTLSVYPYAVAVKLQAVPQEGGDPYTVASFTHPGGAVTVPYAVPKGTVLILTVLDKEHKRITVQ